MPRPLCLTIAGSDPSGGAGLQADLKTFHQFGVHGAAAVTLVTVQNTRGVEEVHLLDPTLVERQILAVTSDLPVSSIKSGAIGNAAIARAVARALQKSGLSDLVVDPVLVSKHGASLMTPGDAHEVARLLFPQARVATPNWHEAEALLGLRFGPDEAVEAAGQLARETGCPAILLKGGHREGEPFDTLWDRGMVTILPGKRIHTPHTHGTGCTLSAALAACLSRGIPLARAAWVAKEFVARAIAQAPGLGNGQGPVDHFAPIPWEPSCTDPS